MPRLLHYLAYGSNLHPLRLQERVPSAVLFQTVELNGYCLRFNKRGEDGSAKCNLESTPKSGHRAHGVIFRMDAGDKPTLDRAESGYEEVRWELTIDGSPLDVFTYIARPERLAEGLQPFDWYKALVLLGVRYHGFPGDYLRGVEAVKAVLDRDAERRRQRKQLLATMMQANARL